ncbi:hypothetical protein AcW2_000638 [Taiwanofungus camphoratus]|nr:hypothetical protein AcW2_000638 [Antrodia cinnamomea]
MLGSLLPSRSNARKVSHTALQHSASAPSQTPLRNDVDQASTTRPSMERAVTAALSTPHDAVLAELHGHNLGVNTATKTDTPPEAQKLNLVASATSLEHSEQTASPSAQAIRSAASSPTSAQEPLYDPYSGNLVGVMMSPTTTDRHPGPDYPGTQFDRTKDELWSHLTRIRELQNEIAGMHVQMEGIGAGEARGAKRPAAGVGRVHSDTIHAGEDWEDPGEAEEQRKAARDLEFANLAESFKGRRAAIDGIMSKLDDLSKSLTTFHALPTPVMDFTNSRSNTKDSVGTSPDLNSPTASAPRADQRDTLSQEDTRNAPVTSSVDTTGA